MSPPRYTIDIKPRETKVVSLAIQNLTGDEMDMRVVPVDLAVPEGEEFVQEVPEGKYGVGEWIRPELREFRLAHGERIIMSVTIKAPDNPPAGSTYAGLRIFEEKNLLKGQSGVQPQHAILSQIFITVPGDVVRKGKIVDFAADKRFIYGDKSFVALEYGYRNAGNATEITEGTLKVKTIFGNTVKTFKYDDYAVLRETTRGKRYLWSNVPTLGLFRAELKVKSQAGTDTAKSQWMVAVPPWWWFVLFFGAILISGLIWHRRRRRWNELLAALADQDSEDEYYDDEGFEDEER